MRKRGKQLVSLILAGALAGSLAGCMPTQSKETAAAPAKTQDTKAAENAAGADPEAAGADILMKIPLSSAAWKPSGRRGLSS